VAADSFARGATAFGRFGAGGAFTTGTIAFLGGSARFVDAVFTDFFAGFFEDFFTAFFATDFFTAFFAVFFAVLLRFLDAFFFGVATTNSFMT